MTNRKPFLAAMSLFLSATLFSCTGPLAPEMPETTDIVVRSAKPTRAAPKPLVVFHDHFETDKNWGIFEEIVGGSSCYGDGIGEVARTQDLARNGRHSLRVWANKANSHKSNHVLANNQLSTSGQTGIYRYEMQAYIAPETASSGQTGPEFSMQNTRQITPGQYRTSIAGIQYIANPYMPRMWQIWSEIDQAPGQATWHVLLEDQPLQPGTWYSLALEVNFDTNRYVRFWLRGPDVNLSIDLSAYRIAPETKFSEEAFWLTLESENLWNNCGAAGAFHYKVYYDKIKLRKSSRSR